MRAAEYRTEALLFESARLSILEMRMIGRERMERLLEAEDVECCVRMLSEYGVGIKRDADGTFLREETLSARLREVYAELFSEEKSPKFLTLWLYPYDCNNLKLAIKCGQRGIDCRDMLFDCGTVDAGKLLDMVSCRRYEELPERLAAAAEEASAQLAKVGDPQVVDFLLDRACYELMTKTARESGSEFVISLLRTKVDLTNLTVCIRLMRMTGAERVQRLLEQVYLPGGSFSLEELAALCIGGEEQLWQSLRKSDYAAFAQGLGVESSLSRIELAADNCLIDMLKAGRQASFGAEMLIGYLLGSEYEVRNLRILLSGIEIGLPKAALRERIRNSYV